MKKIRKYLFLLFYSFSLFWKSSKLFTILLFIIIPLQGFIPVLNIAFAKNIVDAVSIHLNSADAELQIVFWLCAWIITYLLSGILSPCSMYIQGGMTDKMINLVNVSLMNKSNEIKDISFFEESGFYDEIQVLQEEAAWRPVNLIVFFLNVLRGIITTVSLFVLIANFHILIAVLMFVAIVPQTFVYYRLQEEAFENMVTKSPLSRKLKYFFSLLLSHNHAYESRMFAYGKYFTGKYQETFDRIHADTMKIRKKQTILSTLWSILGTVTGSVAFAWLIFQTMDGHFTIGDILAFTSVIMLSGQTMIALVQESSLLYDTLMYVEKFLNFLNLPIRISSGNKILPEGINSIEFRNVSFKYPGSKSFALNNISFSIKKNEKTALVGENGSGKSTIMKLICRLYDVIDGNILINGENIVDFDIESLRKDIGIVFQDYSKYHLSLRDNVAISDIYSKGNDSRFEYAVNRSGVDKIMSGYGLRDYQMLGKTFENGKELSEGEWQKVAISRAYFKESTALLFDEPSSALDAVSEAHFFDSMEDISKDKLVLFVTHKLSGAAISDKIIVLDNGKKVEEGKHERLLEMGGKYSELFTLQSERYK